ncbi:hypothetical protein MTO96_044331, partial [Rhipicephalus appendiculatus]
SGLRADDDCPCRRGGLPGGALVGTPDHSTKNVVDVTTRKAVSKKHRRRIGCEFVALDYAIGLLVFILPYLLSLFE